MPNVGPSDFTPQWPHLDALRKLAPLGAPARQPYALRSCAAGALSCTNPGPAARGLAIQKAFRRGFQFRMAGGTVPDVFGCPFTG